MIGHKGQQQLIVAEFRPWVEYARQLVIRFAADLNFISRNRRFFKKVIYDIKKVAYARNQTSDHEKDEAPIEDFPVHSCSLHPFTPIMANNEELLITYFTIWFSIGVCFYSPDLQSPPLLGYDDNSYKLADHPAEGGKGMAQIGLIRHGSTLWNKTGRVQGLTDNPLDEEGLQQAALLARKISGQSWDRIYASDLIRARQTAEIIAAELGIAEIKFDSRLREMDAGLIEGTTEEERRMKWGKDWKALDLGLEQPDAGMERGAACIAEIACKHPGERILIVSHGILLRNSLRKLVPELNVQPLLGNTAMTMLTFEGDVWTCELFNSTAHLEEL